MTSPAVLLALCVSAGWGQFASPLPSALEQLSGGVQLPDRVPAIGSLQERSAEGVAPHRSWAISLLGSADFVRRTESALALLARSGELPVIEAHLSEIREFPCSGVYVETAVFHVGRLTWESEPVWYAGTIAHDACHVRLYREAKARAGNQEPDHETFAGEAGERLCLGYQTTVLGTMEAPQPYIDYLARLSTRPEYQNVGRGKTEFGTGSSNDLCGERRW